MTDYLKRLLSVEMRRMKIEVKPPTTKYSYWTDTNTKIIGCGPKLRFVGDLAEVLFLTLLKFKII